MRIMQNNIVELVDKQTKIISQQNEIIDELFRLLLQHIEAEELAGLPTYRKMQELTKTQNH